MANNIIMTGCSFKGGEGSTAIRLRGDGFNLNVANTKFETSTGIDVTTADTQIQALREIIIHHQIERSEFTRLVEELSAKNSAEDRKSVAKHWITSRLSVVADVTGLSQFILAISASPKLQEVIEVLFS